MGATRGRRNLGRIPPHDDANPASAKKRIPKFASKDGEPTVVPIEEVVGLSRAYRKEAEKARAAARDGVDRPARPAAVGHIPILRSAANMTIVPMKLLELWQVWVQRRGLDLHPPGRVEEPPAAFVTDVSALIKSQ